MMAPERMCPPISADFSTTVTAMSGCFCLSAMRGGETGGAGTDDQHVGGERFAITGLGQWLSSTSERRAAARGGLNITERMAENRPAK